MARAGELQIVKCRVGRKWSSKKTSEKHILVLMGVSQAEK